MSTVIRRAAIDIGSGATKLSIADVLISQSSTATTSTIIQTMHFGNEYPVPFSADFLKSATNCLSESIQTKGLSTLQTILQVCVAYNVTAYSAIATEVFRRASNGEEYLNRVRDLGVRVRVISQREEAMLGYLTGVEVFKYSRKRDVENHSIKDGGNGRLIVWDSGGGSFQISSIVEDVSTLECYMGEVGALGSFKLLNSEVRRTPLADASSTNPVGLVEAEELVQCIRSRLDCTIPSWLQGADVIAIGGPNSIFQIAARILQYIEPSTPSTTVLTERSVSMLLAWCANRSDEELLFLAENEHADPPYLVVPKLCLLLAVMRHASISSAAPALCIGSCAGLLSSADFW